jgi:Cof subfamily protein (haloacid dehalogenase superfamily)
VRAPDLESRHVAPRVIAADLDGTLLPLRLDGTQTLTPLSISAVSALGRGGITTILVTGRMFRSAARYARDLGLDGPVAAYQGALIREVGSGHLIHHDPLSVESALEVLYLLEPAGHPVNLYIEDELYVARRSEEVDRYERLSGMKANVVGRLSSFLDRPTTKIGVGGDPAIIEGLLTSLRAQFEGRLIVVKTWPFFLEMTSPTATKARALQILGKRLGFAAHDVLAFGDSYNDADMLAWAGTGVAMRGAPPEVMAAADFVCDPVERDGFARYLMSQPWFPVEGPS